MLLPELVHCVQQRARELIQLLPCRVQRGSADQQGRRIHTVLFKTMNTEKTLLPTVLSCLL